MGIIFSEGSGVNDSIYGKSQAPIRMFLEKKAEAFEQESMLPHIFNISNSKNYAEKVTSLTGTNGFQPVGENGDYPVDNMEEGYSKTIEHVTWKDKFYISREMIDDSRLMDLRKRPQNFVTGYYRTRETFGAALLGGAIRGVSDIGFGGRHFDARCADGGTLFQKQHPNKVDKKKQSNQFSDAFSNEALFAMEAAMQNFTGDNGEILAVTPDTIVIPNDYALKAAVFAAIGADKDPATANNGYNYNFGRWNVLVSPYLNKFIASGTSPWVLMSSQYNKDNGGALWFDRVPLEVKSDIAENDANVWKGYSRFNAGFNDWRAFAVGGVSGGTQLIV